MKPLFPYYGNKERVVAIIWDRLGNVKNYVEPFIGSGAVLLGRPIAHLNVTPRETINDSAGLVSNFFRAVKIDPKYVAECANFPVSELDIHAKNKYLINGSMSLTGTLLRDPEYYDPKMAGWWVWGQKVAMMGIWGIRADKCKPNSGRSREPVTVQDVLALSQRLRGVVVLCGGFERCLTPSYTTQLGITGVVLDPPYPSNRVSKVYADDSQEVFTKVVAWCVQNQNDPKLRIALCGYEGYFSLPPSWEKVEWSANGGNSNTKKNRSTASEHEKRHLERIWFSPNCLKREGTLLELMEEGSF